MNSRLTLQTTLIASVLSIVCATAILAQPKVSVTKFTWLVGSWKGTAANKPFYEAWRKTSANKLTQYGIKITGKDTVVSEIGAITISETKTVYGDEQHTWSLSELTNDKMVFMNAQINFPKTITWQKMPNGHWYCLLAATTQKIEYDIVRLPALDAVVDKWINVNRK